MYSFQVKVTGGKRVGSVVSAPMISNSSDGVHVVVMWDDDFTFSTHDVRELEAVPMKEEGAKPKVVPFPGGGNDTAH